MKKRYWIVLLLLAVTAAAVTIGIDLVTKEEPVEPVEYDTANVATSVDEVLLEMANNSLGEGIDVNEEGTGLVIDEELVETSDAKNLLSVEKAKFRLKLENKLFSHELEESEIEQMAEESVRNSVEALEKASSLYDVEVYQDEVTDYINENVASVEIEDKQIYAEALGISVDALDYYFDRDFYVMDVLWEKLISALMEQYPQGADETTNDYMQRIKDEFYDASE
ncbi:hypothetical protein JOD03_000667 [Chryseomicrobium aureum]|uniref:hypothetical protein n=1 Tax=Chryseomicrobium aureum TaxID=1441723 RepID=UPI0019598AD4|nr:hypothetical protein [Chryseomicrobium aureum]MBM7705766.1 hypothetical protein [Chryseomicrobium aureum]